MTGAEEVGTASGRVFCQAESRGRLLLAENPKKSSMRKVVTFFSWKKRFPHCALYDSAFTRVQEQLFGSVDCTDCQTQSWLSVNRPDKLVSTTANLSRRAFGTS